MLERYAFSTSVISMEQQSSKNTIITAQSNHSGIPYDRIIYFRVVEACNLHCSHCFIPANPKRMSLSQIVASCRKLNETIRPEDRVLIQWHGGEPTLVGALWLENAINIINKSLKVHEITHGIQTNLMTYNNEWRDLYRKYFENHIGISWDPFIRHKRQGKRLSNSDYELAFWDNHKKLVKDGIASTMIITTTKRFFDHFKIPWQFFSFATDRDITEVHFERLTRTGYARQNWASIGLSNLEYSQYMSRYYQAYAQYERSGGRKGIPLRISPFDGLRISVEGLLSGESTSGYGCLSGVCDSRFYTVDANGLKEGCTALTSEHDNSAAIETVPLKFYDIAQSRIERTADCETCEFRPICSSGCLASDRIDPSGECSGAKQLFTTIANNLKTRSIA